MERGNPQPKIVLENGTTMRPCGGCERGSPFEGLYNPKTQCRICYLYYNSPDYKAYWDGKPPEQYPSALKQAASFAKATAEWVSAGRPERTELECIEIHKICESCEHFDAKQDRCVKCGCGLSDNSATSWVRNLGVANAIKMATHHCPIGRW